MKTMDAMFLSRFRTKDFRSFGSVDLAFPRAPGVVILDGPNGLGKTSWFEAVELALTGQVHRWDRLQNDHKLKPYADLVRKESGQSACEISLEFTSRGSTRRAAFSGGSFEQDYDPALWLCADPGAWSLTADNLLGFLRGTHFLPQSPHLRLLHLSEEKRWDQVLGQVSGYADIAGLSDNISGTGAQFTILVGEAETAAATARSLATDWRRRVDAYQAQETALRTAADALSPRDALSILDADDRQGEERWFASPEGARFAIASLADSATRRREQRLAIDRQRTALAPLAASATEWLGLSGRLSDGERRAREHEAGRAAVVDGMRAASEAATKAQEALKTASAEAHASQARLTLLEELEQAQQSLRRITAVAKDERRRQVSAAAVLESAAARVTFEKERLARRVDWERSQKALELALRRVRQQRLLRSELGQLRTAFDAGVVQVATLTSSSAAASESLKRIRDSLARKQDEQRRVDGQLVADRLSTTEGQAAVALLASRVNAQDTECPLCHAHYPPTGELLERVRRALNRGAPALVALEREAAVLLVALDDLRAQEAELISELARVRLALDETEAQQSNLRLRIDEVHGRLEHGDEFEDELLDQQILALEAELADHVRDAIDVASSAKQHEELVSAEADVIDAEREEARAVTAATANEAAAQRMRNDLEALQERLGISSDTVVEELILSAAAVLRDASVRAESAVAYLAETRRSVAEAKTAELRWLEDGVQIAAAVSEARTLMAIVEGRWQRAGLSMPPVLDAVAVKMNVLEAEAAEAGRRLATIIYVSEAVSRWLAAAGIQELASALDLDAGGTGGEAWSAHARSLEMRIEAAEKRVERATLGARELDRIAAAVRTRREAMRSTLAARLQRFLAPMLRALVTNDDIAGSLLSFGEARSRTRVAATLRDGGTSLLVRASEGQLAGVNLAVQLAMALAFPWSRWRAVLLDDPTQYSDVIHCANLVETLRVLSRQHGFQLFLSTHERDFARYVEQKFANDGLAATRVVFRSPVDSSAGVVPIVASPLHVQDGVLHRRTEEKGGAQ